jgi:hypothetical protein
MWTQPTLFDIIEVNTTIERALKWEHVQISLS